MFSALNKPGNAGIFRKFFICSIFCVIPFAFLFFLCYNSFGFKAIFVSVNVDTGFMETGLFYLRRAAENFS